MLPPLLPEARTAVVLDFDGVFFDSEQLVRVWAAALELKTGVSSKDTMDLYDRVKVERETPGRSSFECFVRALGRYFGDDYAESHVAGYLTEKACWVAPGLVFQDAVDFCKKVKERCEPVALYILSAGNPEFQKAKIRSSGVAELFQRENIAAEPMRSGILITQDDKGPYIWELSKHYDQILFADDKPSQLKSVWEFMCHQGAAGYPVQYVYINRKNAKLSDVDDVVMPLWVASRLDPVLFCVLSFMRQLEASRG